MRSFWASDRGLSVLLALLVAMIVVVPALQSYAHATLFVQVFFAGIIVSGLIAATTQGAARLAGVLLMVFAIAVYWIDRFHPDAGLAPWTAVGRLGATGLLVALVLRQVFREGPVTVQRIEGAIVAYLLLGLMWSGVYELIRDVWPAAFRFTDAPQARSEVTPTLVYFSFVTLTTMGYGDILPVHPVARSAAILEALTGQLFPAILIARLVSMELAGRERADRS